MTIPFGTGTTLGLEQIGQEPGTSFAGVSVGLGSQPCTYSGQDAILEAVLEAGGDEVARRPYKPSLLIINSVRLTATSGSFDFLTDASFSLRVSSQAESVDVPFTGAIVENTGNTVTLEYPPFFATQFDVLLLSAPADCVRGILTLSGTAPAQAVVFDTAVDCTFYANLIRSY
ncbi:MAG: hypothetical protein HYV26_21075 [Candidatus Hydrogenedentes bacterium]|nr:hypothetical protein [Candidatus Hydrogenedentota bacterium]